MTKMGREMGFVVRSRCCTCPVDHPESQRRGKKLSYKTEGFSLAVWSACLSLYTCLSIKTLHSW